ncbi:TOBE domain-containing protein, partial [Actinophytocola sp.]|uniref:TOBE domain-containing protein n=1 Tax=Actinophytocola sp. TaxID=1872138 RepID=UPI00389A1DDA
TQCAEPTDVYDNPASEFVGGFLGSPPMNFLSGTVSENGRGLALTLGDQWVPVPAELSDYRDRRLDLGVRAESLQVVGADAPEALTCTVEVYEPLGSSVLLTTVLSGQRVKVTAPPGFRAAPGDELRVAPTRTRWYDPETQLLLEVR